MNQNIRYLTKSRFKLAAECPRKLFYVNNKEYLDRSSDDGFLESLAEGGYQVGKLACLMHPGGIPVDSLDHRAALDQTAQLLKQDEVTIFEAALAVGPFFIRVDILRKQGSDIDLVEVKAKSYSAKEDGNFWGPKGKLKSNFLPYLRDVAFQSYVAQRALPGHRVRAFLMMADKEQQATVDGLNQRFKVIRRGKSLHIEVTPGSNISTIGAPLLKEIPVDDQVSQILGGKMTVGPAADLPFAEAVAVFADAYMRDTPLPPLPSAECANCQFKAPSWPALRDKKSGFHECWSQAFGWEEADFAEGTVLDLWNYSGKSKLIENKILKSSEITLEYLGFDGQAPGPAGMTRKHRQWYIGHPEWPGGGDHYFDKAGFLNVAAKWKYPLHCIDFETSIVAIPFIKGRHPYEMTAFQFSHHVIKEDGQIAHRMQWISAKPGVDPNLDFVRELRNTLIGDDGTILRWGMHENSVLNQLRTQMLQNPEATQDTEELIAFIEQITTRSDGVKGKIIGKRNMVDLCDIAEKYYFHPLTKGSNSLKKVLPALMRSSPFLREEYGEPKYGGDGRSLNFKQPIAWWQIQNGEVIDPYKLLPSMFDDVSVQEMEATEENISGDLREGGAAMAAYARLQFENLSEKQRQDIIDALFRYCELDTLAMVMAVQAWYAAASH